MAEPLKNIYNPKFFSEFTEILVEVLPNFDEKEFLKDIHDAEWDNRELKQRMRHITTVLQQHLGDDFVQNAATIVKITKALCQKHGEKQSLEYMFLPDFIEVYGVDNFAVAVPTFEQISLFTSCEFAVRIFILKYEKKMSEQMQKWSKHPHEYLRRFATEGMRPRLPWASAIPAFKKNPAQILPILETLKNDSSPYVRKSVANNLNDISKDNPDLVIDMIRQWQGKTTETDRIVKHAARTLLKQGNSEVMQLFGFASPDEIELEDFTLLTPTVKIGEYLEFTFNLKNTSDRATKIRLEYGVYFLKANGSLSRKVFNISEKEYAANSLTSISKRQSFKPITTRKYYAGRHEISLIVNGEELAKQDFELKTEGFKNKNPSSPVTFPAILWF